MTFVSHDMNEMSVRKCECWVLQTFQNADKILAILDSEIQHPSKWNPFPVRITRQIWQWITAQHWTFPALWGPSRYDRLMQLTLSQLCIIVRCLPPSGTGWPLSTSSSPYTWCLSVCSGRSSGSSFARQPLHIPTCSGWSAAPLTSWYWPPSVSSPPVSVYS